MKSKFFLLAMCTSFLSVTSVYGKVACPNFTPEQLTTSLNAMNNGIVQSPDGKAWKTVAFPSWWHEGQGPIVGLISSQENNICNYKVLVDDPLVLSYDGTPPPDWGGPCPFFTGDQIKTALAQLKNGRIPGTDGRQWGIRSNVRWLGGTVHGITSPTFQNKECAYRISVNFPLSLQSSMAELR